MDDIRLELGEGLLKGAVVVLLKFVQLAIRGHPRMTESSIQKKAAMEFPVAFLGVQTVVGSDGEHRMATQPQGLGDRLTPQIECPRVMRRIEISQDKDSHSPPPNLNRRLHFGEPDRVVDANATGFNHLGHDTLTA